MGGVFLYKAQKYTPHKSSLFWSFPKTKGFFLTGRGAIIYTYAASKKHFPQLSVW
jgi:hypothetical protein